MPGLRFCTMFDHNYLPRGLVLYESLRKRSPDAELHVLCFSDECFEYLKAAALPGVFSYPLKDVEAFEPRLAEAKKDRRRTEYLFTLTPIWPLFLFDRLKDADLLFLIDADTKFFADPALVLKGQEKTSVAIVGHKFPPRLKHVEDHGIYNVAFEFFRRDEKGLACLRWWADRCLEWCHDYPDQGRYADQGYLDRFPELFGAVPLTHKGVNVAPWNVDNYRFTVRDGAVYVDEDPLVFFHFASLRPIGLGWVDSGFGDYDSRMTPVLRDAVYKPYLAELNAQQRGLFSSRALRGKSDSATWGLAKKAAFQFRQALKHGRSILSGSAVRA